MRKILKKYENGLLFAQAMLTIIGLFMTGYTLLMGGMSRATIFSIVIYLLLVLYSCWLFKKPHGNYLKIIGLLLCASIIYTGITVVKPIESMVIIEFNQLIDNLLSYMFLISALCVAHVSGRLNKYTSNIVVLIIAVVLLIVAVSYYQGVIHQALLQLGSTQQQRFAVHFASYNPPILVSTFAIAYLTRYEAHIQAGEEYNLKLFKE